VHLADIHLEKGMHCIDCHFAQDVHGNGKLYGETRNASRDRLPGLPWNDLAEGALKTSGPASANDVSSNLLRMRTPFKQARFYWRDGKLWQRSNVDRAGGVGGGADARHHHSGQRALQREVAAGEDDAEGRRDVGPYRRHAKLAHSDKRMTCQSCHSSWTTSCFGCHLSMSANQKMPMLHNEGETTRNWTAYNFQVLRDDVYMLGIDGR
jgi:hypothetical protein